MSAIITVIKAIEKDSCRLLQLQTRAAKETAANDYNCKQGLLKNQLPALQLQTRAVEKTAADCYSYKQRLLKKLSSFTAANKSCKKNEI